MRILALDIGRVRTGIAASDATASIASPVTVLRSEEVFSNAKTFRRVLEDYEPDVLVIGLPVSLDGEENDHAQWVRSQAEKISNNIGIDVEFVDERLSSSQAKRILREQGLSEKEMRGKIDMVAASLFLQVFLDGNKTK